MWGVHDAQTPPHSAVHQYQTLDPECVNMASVFVKGSLSYLDSYLKVKGKVFGKIERLKQLTADLASLQSRVATVACRGLQHRPCVLCRVLGMGRRSGAGVCLSNEQLAGCCHQSAVQMGQCSRCGTTLLLSRSTACWTWSIRAILSIKSGNIHG